MNKVYLYSRVSTSEQSLEQQERTVYEWLKAHNMKVDEVVSDEGISGGVSYKERGLGKVILPKIKEGDMLIVAEISRLGRSMFDLSKLIHEELKPRKVRLVVVGMGIDLDCSKMTPIDSLVLSNFSFAAELEKHLLRERTRSALQVKKQQGIKLGAASDKYKATQEAKGQEVLRKEAMKRGATKSKRFIESADVVAFMKVVRRVFPQYCNDEDYRLWGWSHVNSKRRNATPMLQMMKDFNEMNGSLFKSWDFSDMTTTAARQRLNRFICSIKRSMSNSRYNSLSV